MTEAPAVAIGDAPLVEGAMDRDRLDYRPFEKPSAALSAARMLASLGSEEGVFIVLATSERRAEEVAQALKAFADPDSHEILLLPAWDCLPFDRASPSCDVQGRRLAVFAHLATQQASPRRLVVLSPEAMVQRSPPTSAISARMDISTGQAFNREAFGAFARQTGYREDERVDEPGEIALLGEVVDVFPAAADRPVRITIVNNRVSAIQTYDPLSQRTLEICDTVTLTPASELLLDAETERSSGSEHWLGQSHGPLLSTLDRIAGDRLFVEPSAVTRCFKVLQRVEDAHGSREAFGETSSQPLPGPSSLYLTARQAEDQLANAVLLDLDQGMSLSRPAVDPRPGSSLRRLIETQCSAGRRVVISGVDKELRAIGRMLKRLGVEEASSVTTLDDILASPKGSLLSLVADLDRGFDDATLNTTVIAATDVLGARAAQGATQVQSVIGEPELRLGDVVIHEDHGVGILVGLEYAEIAGVVRDVVRLEYYGGATVLAPVEDFGRLWRYGSEPAAIALDRLNTDAWHKRRAEISLQIDATAAHLVELAKTREDTTCDPVVPPKSALNAFAARFPFPETPDQVAAIDAVLSDLASGRPMNRLVCGDVGFGKTEVALRAAAALALSGRQVLVAAPTTVLARQHVDTFRRRFEGTGVQIGHLSRLSGPGEGRLIRAGLKTGDIGIVIGTHALASEALEFSDLGLTIIDEEHRFGSRLKQVLQRRAPHTLVMTATPIPRTLLTALIGIQDVSVIASPPSRRRPIRTFLTDYDGGSVRTALLREKQRGGQSFVVVPRVEDIGPISDELARLVPELTITAAHGQMTTTEIDDAMVGFADGDSDVLLATNIIETGLDVPRANTMIVLRPELFGLAQLHQLRGRVGRSRAQGFVYLLTEPETDLSEATRARIGTLEAFDRLGAGFAISARDLDLRGSGDILGDDQAGHMKLIGFALYQSLLERAVRAARGEQADGFLPAPRLDPTAGFPEAYIPDQTLRINLYARLARLTSTADVDAIEDEIADRFGPLPDEVAAVLAEARISALAAEAGVTRIVAGPKAIALSLRGERLDAARAKLPDDTDRRWVDDRLVLEAGNGRGTTNMVLEAVLADLAA